MFVNAIAIVIFRETQLANEKSQRDRFTETARNFGADYFEAAFKTKLAVIARQTPKDEPTTKAGKQ